MNPIFIENMSWRMGEVYGAVTDRILINLARHFKYFKDDGKPLSGGWDYQVRKLAELGQVNRETEAIILSSLDGADAALAGVLEESIRESLKGVEKPLKQAAERGLLLGAGIPEVSPNQMQAFQAFYRQSADKLNLVNTVMLESTQQAYQATVADIANRINAIQGVLNVGTGEVVTGVSSLNQAVRDGVKKMVDIGITGYIDHGGHHWTPEAYVTMDVRTTMANTGRAAVWERMEAYGDDLYQVSYHDGARPLCYDWQGKVISRYDMSREVEDDEGNTVHVYAQSETTYGQAAGLFGINCKHYPIPFIPGFSRIRKPEQNREENDKEYAESQQQRALERKYRYEKRDLSVLKAQGASDEEIKAQKERVKTARQNLDDFCTETGRARRSSREGTPIKATWPDSTGNAPRPQRKAPVPSGNASVPVPAAKPPVTIQTAKTFDELSKAVSDAYNGATLSDGVKKLEFTKVKNAVTGVKAVTDEFTDVGKNIREIITKNTGVMSCNGSRITFNPDYYNGGNKLQDAIDRSVRSGWWPKGTTAESIGVHEAAHGIEYFLDMHSPDYTYYYERVEAWNKCTIAKSIVLEACKNIKKTPYGKGKKNVELIQAVSGYATRNASETLAESFADVYCNGDKASPLAREIRRLTKELYIKFGGATNGR